MKKFFNFFLSVVILLSVNTCAYAASSDEIDKSFEYKYKITSESIEWKEFVSHQEMVDACQLSDHEIKKMSTEKLLSAYLNYPLLGDMYAYSTTEAGFNALRKQCNVLDELLSRKDTGKVILNKYKSVELYDSNTIDSAAFNAFIEPSALEILAAQPEIIDNMDNTTFIALNDAIYKKA